MKFSLQRLSLSQSLSANSIKNWESAAWHVECLFIESDRTQQRNMTSEDRHNLTYSGSSLPNWATQSNHRSGGYRQKTALPI
ncbi:hypothetical protein [Chlorogloea sp. CCALA 695]|uniref:hypothetical protein n=1 Tax=Chlorogloea sp. CCALA 695 TaxID=2107693 RepID=UPI0011B2075B|nr:hypothetical protein [Chlorogloea sp. CCALA 695]